MQTDNAAYGIASSGAHREVLWRCYPDISRKPLIPYAECSHSSRHAHAVTVTRHAPLTLRELCATPLAAPRTPTPTRAYSASGLP